MGKPHHRFLEKSVDLREGSASPDAKKGGQYAEVLIRVKNTSGRETQGDRLPAIDGPSGLSKGTCRQGAHPENTDHWKNVHLPTPVAEKPQEGNPRRIPESTKESQDHRGHPPREYGPPGEKHLPRPVVKKPRVESSLQGTGTTSTSKVLRTSRTAPPRECGPLEKNHLATYQHKHASTKMSRHAAMTTPS